MQDLIRLSSCWDRHNVGTDVMYKGLTGPLAFRSRIHAGHRLLGSFLIEMTTPAAVESYALAGFDFVVLDLEHSAVDFERLSSLITACRACQVASVVRIQARAYGTLTRVLDMHPDSVMIPAVATASEAEGAVRASRFHPDGERGLAPMVRHEAAVGREFGLLNDHLTLIVQVEGADAAANAEDIAAVRGVDVVFVGPYRFIAGARSSRAAGSPSRTGQGTSDCCGGHTQCTLGRIRRAADRRGTVVGLRDNAICPQH